VKEYAIAADRELTLQEELCLDYIAEVQRGSVLDIGIGAGRTVGPLSRMFRRYTGIDYSAPMVAEARRRFPGHDLRVMDARKLDFSDAFDCVFFSYNGIDYMRFEERGGAFHAICRALSPGGLFIFSTHNLHHRHTAVWINNLSLAEIASVRPLVRWPDVGALLMRSINFWRQRENREAGFAYINDPAHGFSILTLYVDIHRQISALQQMGFSVLATIGNTKTRSASMSRTAGSTSWRSAVECGERLHRVAGPPDHGSWGIARCLAPPVRWSRRVRQRQSAEARRASGRGKLRPTSLTQRRQDPTQSRR
jgi:SAM-dependent methyltransferase